MFKGQSIQVRALGDGYVELCFDREGDAINKLDSRTVDELRRATAEIAGVAGLQGVLVTSAKNVFIVGADITEFGEMFKLPVPELAAHNARSNEVFNAFEDLPVPTVVAGVDTDRLFPLRDQRELADGLPNCTGLRVIVSRDGHDGFLTEAGQIAPVIQETLALVG